MCKFVIHVRRAFLDRRRFTCIYRSIRTFRVSFSVSPPEEASTCRFECHKFPTEFSLEIRTDDNHYSSSFCSQFLLFYRFHMFPFLNGISLPLIFGSAARDSSENIPHLNVAKKELSAHPLPHHLLRRILFVVGSIVPRHPGLSPFMQQHLSEHFLQENIFSNFSRFRTLIAGSSKCDFPIFSAASENVWYILVRLHKRRK